MSSNEGNRNNPYSFDDYLLVRNNFNYYRDDQFLQTLVKHYVPDAEYEIIDRDLRALSDYVSNKWKDLADKAAEPENRLKV
ncbi:MAG: acyl-CoA dehydrogenase, partial [Candidatus Heimdallarchaeota archaeon]